MLNHVGHDHTVEFAELGRFQLVRRVSLQPERATVGDRVGIVVYANAVGP